VIVEVLVAQGDAEDALAEQGALGVGDELGVAGVGEGVVQRVEQSQASVGFTQEQGPGVGGQVAALEVGLHAAGAQAGKGQRRDGTLCHGGGWLLGVLELSQLSILPRVQPPRNCFFPELMQYPG
jgi:hypothetical protein